MRFSLVVPVALMVCALTPVEVSAQSGAFMSTMRTQHGQMMNRVMIRQNVRSGARIRYEAARPRVRGAKQASAAPRAPQPQPLSAQARATSFRTVAPSLVPQILAKDLARSPQEQRAIDANLNEWLTFFRGRLRERGKPVNDVARAATYLIGASYSAYYDAGELNPVTYDALLEDMRDIFASDAAFQRAADKERQEMFESYAITAIMLIEGYGTAKEKGDKAGMRHYRDMARKSWEDLLGLTPEQVALTSSGIEYR